MTFVIIPYYIVKKHLHEMKNIHAGHDFHHSTLAMSFIPFWLLLY
jgi:hypothetical protein